jgi:hypothetical protein
MPDGRSKVALTEISSSSDPTAGLISHDHKRSDRKCDERLIEPVLQKTEPAFADSS